MKKGGVIGKFFLILAIGFIFCGARYALAHKIDREESPLREAIEQTEEKVLGAENHAALEKVEPGVDAFAKKYAPLALGGSILILGTVYYYLKKKN